MVAESLPASLIRNDRPATARQPRAALEGIQVLRGVAAFAVVVHHALEELSGAGAPEFVTRLGAAGVDLFFVISGFIMLYTSTGQFGQPGAGRDFMARRVIRIVPLYWLFTAFILACHLTGVAFKNHAITPHSAIESLLFLPTEHFVVTVGWTLNYEMYFYVLFALCLTFGRSAIAALGVPILLLAGLSLGVLAPVGLWRDFLTDRIALEFAFGMGLAALYGSGRLNGRFAGLALAVGVAGLVASSAWAESYGTGGLAPAGRFLFWGVPAALIVYAALSMGKVRTHLGRAWLKLGDASYSLYLSHGIVMATFARLLLSSKVRALPDPLLLAGAIAVSLVLGWLTYVWVERPLTARLKRAWDNRRRLAAG